MVHSIACILRLTQLVATLLVAGLFVAMHHYLSGFIQASEWVQHTQEELVQIEKARTEVLRSEILLRNYLLSLAPESLAQVHTSTAEMREVMERLSALRRKEHGGSPEDEAATRLVLSEMEQLQQAYLALLTLAHRPDNEELRRFVQRHVEAASWRPLRNVLNELELKERQALQQRQEVQRRQLQEVRGLLLKVAVLGSAVLLWALWRSEHLLRVGRRALMQLTENALRDPLTGLLNRRELYQQLARRARRTLARQEQAAVLLFDLDQFKPVNDQHGHAAGDKVLKAVGERLSQQCRGHDIVARLGGDEFVVVLGDMSSREAAMGMAQRLQLTLQEPIDIGGTEVRVDVSIGVAMLPADGRDPDQLLQVADAGMYQAKHQGKGRVASAAIEAA